jgi:hypothetical protein
LNEPSWKAFSFMLLYGIIRSFIDSLLRWIWSNILCEHLGWLVLHKWSLIGGDLMKVLFIKSAKLRGFYIECSYFLSGRFLLWISFSNNKNINRNMMT